MFQSLFYWITYSYFNNIDSGINTTSGFNPYFIGLPILISAEDISAMEILKKKFQSLFYWITYSYNLSHKFDSIICCFNPYFIGLPILINIISPQHFLQIPCFNPYFIGLPILITHKESYALKQMKVSILILLDYLFLSSGDIS